MAQKGITVSIALPIKCTFIILNFTMNCDLKSGDLSTRPQHKRIWGMNGPLLGIPQYFVTYCKTRIIFEPGQIVHFVQKSNCFDKKLSQILELLVLLKECNFHGKKVLQNVCVASVVKLWHCSESIKPIAPDSHFLRVVRACEVFSFTVLSMSSAYFSCCLKVYHWLTHKADTHCWRREGPVLYKSCQSTTGLVYISVVLICTAPAKKQIKTVDKYYTTPHSQQFCIQVKTLSLQW